MNSLEDPIIEDMPGYGTVPMSELNMKELDTEQAQHIVNAAKSNPSVFQFMLNTPEGGSDIVKKIKDGCQKAIKSKPPTITKRVKKGDIPKRAEALTMNRMMNRTKVTGFSGVHFDRTGKTRSVVVTSTDRDFFVKKLSGEIGFSIVRDDIIIAYSKSGRRKNSDAIAIATKYNLDCLNEIKESAIIYSVTRNLTVNDL